MKKKKAKHENIQRGTPQYLLGRRAFDPDNPEPACPYTTGKPTGRGDVRCVGWWAGWLDARIVYRLGNFFENWDGKERTFG